MQPAVQPVKELALGIFDLAFGKWCKSSQPFNKNLILMDELAMSKLGVADVGAVATVIKEEVEGSALKEASRSSRF